MKGDMMTTDNNASSQRDNLVRLAGEGDWPSLLQKPDTLPTDSILSKAETRVASGYVCGMIGKEIADATGTSHNTIIRHTQNIYEKAGIPHSTNSLVAWFLSKNFDIDLSEFRRRVGAALLLGILAIQMYETNFDDSFLRSTAKRVEATRGKRTKTKRKDDDTYYL